ncbi:MAG: TIGR04282 family arsenosugar biosynthesis glycosyltransferase [Thermoanaerobaculia bacterium]
MKPSRALLVFTRTPEAEARAKGLSPERAAGLFAGFLDSWRRAAEEAGARLVLSSPERCADRFRTHALGEGATILAQAARPFGERLASAVGEVFELGFRCVSVVAGDTPALSGGELRIVFEALEGSAPPAVVGPSRDGGVYLIGLGSPENRILREFSLRNPRLCAEVESAFEISGLEVLKLGVRGEVDSLADLQRARLECDANPAWREYGSLISGALLSGASHGREPRSFPLFGPASTIPARAPPAA